MVTEQSDTISDLAAGAVAVHLGTLDVDGPRDGYYSIVGLWLVTDGLTTPPPACRLQVTHWMLPGSTYTLTPGPGRLLVTGGALTGPYWLECPARARPLVLPDPWGEVRLDPATEYLLKPAEGTGEVDWTICQLIGSGL